MNFIKYLLLRNILSLFFILILSALLSTFFNKEVFADTVNVQLNVSVCNANLICEEVIGENYGSCPSDCEPPPPPPTPTSTEPEVFPPTGGYTDYNYGGNSSATNTTSTIPHGNNPQNNTATGTIKNPNIVIPKGSKEDDVMNLPLAGIDGNINIAPYSDHAIITFNSYMPTLINISWGETATYEMGSMADTGYYRHHSKDITGLKPGTRYYYHLILVDTVGRESDYEGYFITGSYSATANLSVVNDFMLHPSNIEDEVLLTWDFTAAFETIGLQYDEKKENLANVQGSDTKLNDKKIYVRLTRSEYGYSVDPLEGEVVYEGSGQQARDRGLVYGKTYYYSIFVLDQDHQYSAPAVIKYTHKKISDKAEDNTNIKLSDGKKIYDPLIKDNRPFYVRKYFENDNATGFCEYYKENPTSLSPDVQFLSQNGGDDGFTLYALHNNKVLTKDDGVITVESGGELKLHLEGKIFSDQDIIGICLFSDETRSSTFYIMPRNPDGSFDLILPSFYDVFSGKRSYEFTLGMLKYSGEKIVLEKGEIRFILPFEMDKLFWIKITFLFLLSAYIFRWYRRRHRESKAN